MESTTVVDLDSSFVVDGHRDILVTLKRKRGPLSIKAVFREKLHVLR
jgi:hypothetical protein